jgi:uncharacterized protein YndB with AHSA1/START domain
MTTPGDQVRVTVGVAVPPAAAFRLFTEDINLWWRRGRRFRNAPGDGGSVYLEPGPGGRLFESYDTPQGERVVPMGYTLVWQPPERLLLRWRAVNFAADEHTEVEVLFEPQGAGTRVTLTHRGWAALRADHPVRHAQPVPDFIRTMGLWWGDQLARLRLLAADR